MTGFLNRIAGGLALLLLAVPAALGQHPGQAETADDHALGDPDAISIVNDNGALIWRVVRGTGWQPGKTVTLWWQSTTPPQGPARAFAFEIDGAQIEASGPFPPEDKPVERTTQR